MPPSPTGAGCRQNNFLVQDSTYLSYYSAIINSFKLSVITSIIAFVFLVPFAAVVVVVVVVHFAPSSVVPRAHTPRTYHTGTA